MGRTPLICKICHNTKLFDAVVNFSPTEAYIYTISPNWKLGENRDLAMGESPTECQAREGEPLPHINHIDCGKCGEAIPTERGDLFSIPVPYEPWMDDWLKKKIKKKQKNEERKKRRAQERENA